MQVEDGTESLAQAGDSEIPQPEGAARPATFALYFVVYDVAENAERAERLESILSDAEKFKALGQSTYATTGGPGEAEEILGRLKQALGGLNEGERLLVARVANVDAALFAEGGKGTEDGREGAKMWAALVK